VPALIVLDLGAPRLERPHLERVALEVVAQVLEHFLRVPVLGEDRVAGVYAQHRVIAIVGRFRPHIARRAAFLAFGDDVAVLRRRGLLIRVAHDQPLWEGNRRARGDRRDLFSAASAVAFLRCYTVCATTAAASAAAMSATAFGSVARMSASGSSTPIIFHC